MFKTPPISVIDLPADADHHAGPRPMPPKFIVLHATAGTHSGPWLSSTSWPPVSCHRLINEMGQTYKLVSDELVAWHAGFAHVGPYYASSLQGSANWVSLGLELENWNKQGALWPSKQIQSAALQIAEWWMLYGSIPVLGHALIDEAKSDPYAFPWDALADETAKYRVP